MTLTRRQKTLIGIFCVGLTALVLDRVLLRPQGGPGAASADSLGQAAESTLLVENLPAVKSGAAPSVAQRLSDLADEEPNLAGLRNPFSLPASWSDKTARGPRVGMDAAARFVRAHELTAVVIDGPRSYVLVDNHLLVCGQTIDGFELVSVAGRSAVFEREGKRVALELLDK
jgi:hypothetical protein